MSRVESAWTDSDRVDRPDRADAHVVVVSDDEDEENVRGDGNESDGRNSDDMSHGGWGAPVEARA